MYSMSSTKFMFFNQICPGIDKGSVISCLTLKFGSLVLFPKYQNFQKTSHKSISIKFGLD